MAYELPRNSHILEIGMDNPKLDHYSKLLFDSIQKGGSVTKSFHIPSADTRHLRLDEGSRLIMLNQPRGGTETILALARVHPYTFADLKAAQCYLRPKMAELFERVLFSKSSLLNPDDTFLEVGAIESIVKKEGYGTLLLSYLQNSAPGIRGLFGEVESDMQKYYASKGFNITDFREEGSRILMWTRL